MAAARRRSGSCILAAALPICLLGCSRQAREAASEPTTLYGADLPPTPHGQDVTRHLAQFHFSGEQRVRKMTERLAGHVQRPWTVERLAAFSAAAVDAERRAAAVYLLAASRDPTALRVVGNALGDQDSGVRVAAAWGIVLYWIGEMHGGGNAESVLSDAQEWWQGRGRK